METKYLNEWTTELNICIRCGYCLEQCPVFEATGWETDAPRGRAILAYSILTGQLEPSQEVADKFFQCTYCRDCFERCSANVSLVDIVSAARADMVKAGFAHDAHEYMLDSVKKSGNIFNDSEMTTPAKEGEVTVFLGCQFNARLNSAKVYLNILERLGIKPRLKKEICCGFPLVALGFREDFEKHKEKFLELLPDDEVIALCPTCAAFLKEEYGKKVKHVIEVIADNIDKLPDANLGTKVTYHDPCDLSRELNLIEEPRKILEKIGVEIVEMPRSKKQSACCGGGGGMLMTDVNLSAKISNGRIHEAVATDAEMLVTPCPTCEKVLKDASATLNKSGEKNIPVRNISSLILKALKKT